VIAVDTNVLVYAHREVEALLQSPTARLLVPGARFWPLLGHVLDEAGATGNLMLDAQIVALCRE
jgi:predicted nucleic acid-binding protein